MKTISGPILRRVSQTKIDIWLVTDKPLKLGGRSKGVGVTVVLTQGQANAYGRVDAPNSRCIHCGGRVFVSLVSVIPENTEETFPLNTLTSYDFVFEEESGERIHLLDSLLINKPIGYSSESPLPSFFIPLSHKNILQGSCRKPHASDGHQGIEDMMVKGDGLVGAARGDVDSRPSLLILSGDQIYADDVAKGLLQTIMKKVVEYDIPYSARQMPTFEEFSSIPISRAELLSKSETAISSSHKEHHLLFFAEYLMYYLVVWGGLVEKLEGHDVQDESLSSENAAVNDFLSTTWHARRLMANTPTLFMFDDHEVTDDWNLTGHFEELYRKEGGITRAIVSNGLATYWLCQGWGNKPGKDSELAEAIENYINTDQAAADYGDKTNIYQKALEGMHWGYTVAMDPPLIALDCRTKREHLDQDGALFHRHSALMNAEGFELLEQDLRGLAKDVAASVPQKKQTSPLLIVSPIPVYGFKPVEFLKDKVGGAFSPTFFDAESWIANTQGFMRLRKILSEQFVSRQCVVISGDVHYGFTRRENAGSRQDGLLNTAYLQLTSSALFNTPAAGFRLKRHHAHNNRKHSRYVCVNPHKKLIVTATPNIGLLTLKNGAPIRQTLFCRDKKGEEYQWNYDLLNGRDYEVKKKSGRTSRGDARKGHKRIRNPKSRRVYRRPA